MKYCASCGNTIEDSAKFCSVCGAKADNGAAQAEYQPDNQQKAENASKLDEVVNKFTNTADTTADYAQDDIDKNRVMAVLAYLGLLFLVPLFAAKESPFARFHTNQGILLFVFEMVGSIAASLIPWIGWVVGTLVGIIGFVMLILGLINSIKGEAKELPFIGKFRILK